MFNVSELDLLQIISVAESKKIILYGSDRVTENIINKLKCLDVEVAYCVDDNLSDIQVSVEVKDIYSLVLEEDEFYVYIAKEDRGRCGEVLEGLGLEFYGDYNSIYRANMLYIFDEIPLDVNLGYGMQKEKEGIKIFGNIDTAKYVIAILGGSTSDPCAYTWKSWGECLWEYNKDEWAVIVAAVIGYSSSEEILKLLRDIIPFRPNLVISYSGVNDFFYDKAYINDYQNYLYGILNKSMSNDRWGGMRQKSVVCTGVRRELSTAERWLNNQRIMHAISVEFGIEYKCFFQPLLYTKYRGINDEKLFYYHDSAGMQRRIHYTQQIRELLEESPLEFIEDATGWLDDYDGLFFDYAHMKEQGNRYIAEKVYKCLFLQKEV